MRTFRDLPSIADARKPGTLEALKAQARKVHEGAGELMVAATGIRTGCPRRRASGPRRWRARSR